MKILPFQSTIQARLICTSKSVNNGREWKFDQMYKSFEILGNENSTAIHNSEYVAKLPRLCAYRPIYLEG